ncbi:methyltransferase domain-containing protein [Paracoccaceae bacterium]|jgi:predicted SAM-dependent methyltransferase|nr:methyltransferase domain-containing protein [Paracoccaceae bacterium]
MSEILEFVEKKSLPEVNLHLGCGGDNIKGWVNLDLYDFDEADTSRSGSHYDIKMDIRQLDLPDNSADKILLVHVMEHFVRWEALKMIRHWYDKLKPGGVLIIETPDLDKCIEWYLKGKDAPHMQTPLGTLNMGFTQFYGNQWSEIDFETHRYVWTKPELKRVQLEVGFSNVEISNEAKFHQAGRDLFSIAIK